MSKITAYCKYKNYFLVEYITNKKGKYELSILSKSSKKENTYYGVCEVMIICEKDADKEINFPITYNNYNESDLHLISPKFNDFKQGDSVDFKLQTYEFNSVRIYIGGKWENIDMVKNENNIFEAKNVMISGDYVQIKTDGWSILEFNNIPAKTN